MSIQLQTESAIYSALTNDATLMGMVTGVHDMVPQASRSEDKSKFPYIEIGDDVFTEWDTSTELGFDGTLTIHVWSQAKSRKESHLIIDRIYELLNRTSPSLDDYWVLDLVHESSEVFRDSDGITHHGITKYNIKAEEK